MKGGLGE
jgi:hypothetical protein